MRNAEIKIGTKFNNRRGVESVVVDILTTTNSKGEVVRVFYVCEHEFCGQTVTDYDVPAATIMRSLLKK